MVLFPLKSFRYQTSSDCSRIVPASVGANELGEWVNAPATLMSEEIYFLKPGKSLHPDVVKLMPNKIPNCNDFVSFGEVLFHSGIQLAYRNQVNLQLQ